MKEGQTVSTPKGRGTVVYVEDDFVVVELSNGVEMDFSSSDIAPFVEGERNQEAANAAGTGQSTKVDVVLNAVLAGMLDRIPRIVEPKGDITDEQCAQVFENLGTLAMATIERLGEQAVAMAPETAFCLAPAEGEAFPKLLLCAMVVGEPPSRLVKMSPTQLQLRYYANLGEALVPSV